MDSITNEETIELAEEVLNDDYPNYDLSFKLIIIGDAGVGKSCVSLKATKNIFENHYTATIGFEFFTFNLKLNTTVIRLQIWDTCGQETYHSLISNFYKNSSLAIVVYSIDSAESFKGVDFWLKELKMQSNPDIKIVLIGNKADLTEKRVITTEQGEQYAKDNNISIFFETSAKTGLNAQKIFTESAKILFSDYMKYSRRRDSTYSESSNKKVENYNPGYGRNMRLSQIKKDQEDRKKKKSRCKC